jgi:hypothetical protein
MTDKLELLARWGYAARGVVYVILGIIALLGSSGTGGEASPQGALSTLLGQPFGRILLAAVALGLIGHVTWRLAQAILNADHQSADLKGYAARAGNLASGLVNGVLAVVAARLVFTSSGGGGSSGEDSFAAWLMQQPLGRFLVGALGASIIIAGAVQLWRGLAGKYRDRVKLPHQHEGFLHGLSVFGLSARGVLLAVTGVFFIFAAITVDAHQAGSLTEALDWVRRLPFGAYLYALAAAGLVAFGLYSFIEARFRLVDAPEVNDLKQTASKVQSSAKRLR